MVGWSQPLPNQHIHTHQSKPLYYCERARKPHRQPTIGISVGPLGPANVFVSHGQPTVQATGNDDNIQGCRCGVGHTLHKSSDQHVTCAVIGKAVMFEESSFRLYTQWTENNAEPNEWHQRLHNSPNLHSQLLVRGDRNAALISSVSSHNSVITIMFAEILRLDKSTKDKHTQSDFSNTSSEKVIL